MHLEGSCYCGGIGFSVEVTAPAPFLRCYGSICRKTGGGGGEIMRSRAPVPGLDCLFLSGYAVPPGGVLPEGIYLRSKAFEITELAGKLRAALALALSD